MLVTCFNVVREGHTLQNKAKIDTETKIVAIKRQGEGQREEIKVKTEVKVYETQRDAEVAAANAELAKKKAGWSKEAQVAEVEAAKAVALREAELQREVERMNAQTHTEKLKAEFLSKASVEYDTKVTLSLSYIFFLLFSLSGSCRGNYRARLDVVLSFETKVQEANWELYKKQKAAEAALYEKEKDAEAQKAIAEATFYTRQQVADAELYAKKKQAEGIEAIAHSQGVYLKTLLEALGGNYMALRDFLMIERGLFEKLARTNAEAVQGLQPKISVWTTEGGSGHNGPGDAAMKEVAGVYRMLPPLFKTVQEQTGMMPPSWMGSLNEPSPQQPNGN